MSIRIETFSNIAGGNAFYKAVTHPLATQQARDLVAKLESANSVAIFDPKQLLAGFDAFFPLDRVKIGDLLVQDWQQIGRTFRGRSARAVTGLSDCRADLVLIAAFDSKGIETHLRPLTGGKEIVSFDCFRLPESMLSDRSRYLSTLNFATNFVFFRDMPGHHTRLTTVNYWAGYGGKAEAIRYLLFDQLGFLIADWTSEMPGANGSIVVDSRKVRKRFDLPAFTGQLFMHVIGAAGHDVVKYALDTYGDRPEVLSCTHDANSWPAELYAGLPAPADSEDVVLWVQNSHPAPIAVREIGLNIMGHDDVAWLNAEVGPYATHRLSVAELLPHARWPQQIEIRAGKHFVRPRYEVFRGQHRRIAHPNVERTDLKPDPNIPKLTSALGKGFILPAPVLPPDRFTSTVLPTPMSTCQESLPAAVAIYDAAGNPCAEHSFGALTRSDSVVQAINQLVAADNAMHYGHMELHYDFASGGEADGWLHALFRYEDHSTGHVAETSFGAHVFNTLMTYKDEPQSYKGPPPGLSTRLFLRVGPARVETFCHLIYPASLPWHPKSDTQLILMSSAGTEVTRRPVQIACGGSLLWRFHEMFTQDERLQAGEDCYVIVRDTTCRLFGYHGLSTVAAFSLDHMFGF